MQCGLEVALDRCTIHLNWPNSIIASRATRWPLLGTFSERRLVFLCIQLHIIWRLRSLFAGSANTNAAIMIWNARAIKPRPQMERFITWAFNNITTSTSEPNQIDWHHLMRLVDLRSCTCKMGASKPLTFYFRWFNLNLSRTLSHSALKGHLEPLNGLAELRFFHLDRAANLSSISQDFCTNSRKLSSL